MKKGAFIGGHTDKSLKNPQAIYSSLIRHFILCKPFYFITLNHKCTL